MGYHRAGFEVVGVDIKPQPRYPFELHIGNALDFPEWGWLDEFDAIHTSPPCQAFTAYGRRPDHVKDSPDLISLVRFLLRATGLPYVIENVKDAPLVDPVMLCGTMFEPPMEIQRHRYFESNVPLAPPQWPCRHKLNGPDRYPGGRSKERTGSSRGLVRATVEIGSWDIPPDVQQRAMGIEWMGVAELSQAIPPVYTELIGAQLLQHIKARAAA
jgi:DNA (cytosine-5)-methyltransferase 1